MQTLEIEVNVYKARHGWRDDRVCDVLGMSTSAWFNKRRGKVQFSAKELKSVSDMLGMSMDDVYKMLPAINH